MAALSNTLMRAAGRALLARAAIAPPRASISLLRPVGNGARTAISSHTRWIGNSLGRNKGLSPDSENPNPKRPDSVAEAPKTAAPLEETDYHELADEYLEAVLAKFEDLQEQRPEVDVEFSAGVLTLTFPPKGTYVINKQPPNKQIWLSSPVTGPKRYDWVVIGDGQNEKEGTATGDWIYLRDGSSLSDLILEEIGVDVSAA